MEPTVANLFRDSKEDSCILYPLLGHKEFYPQKPECEGKLGDIQICSLNLKAAFLYLAQMNLNTDVLSFVTFSTHISLLPIWVQKEETISPRMLRLILTSLYRPVMSNEFGKRHQKLLFEFTLTS